MTYKSGDIKFLDRIIEWCMEKKVRGEYDSEVQELYELACEARPYLLGKTLDEQEYHDKYGNKIMDLAKKFGIYSKFEEIIDGMRKPASTSPVHEYSNKDIRLSYRDYIELGKKIERSARDIDLKYAIGLYKTYHPEDEER